MPANLFPCPHSVLVAACKGIDVTADKLLRKYTEVGVGRFHAYHFRQYLAMESIFWSDD